MPATIGHSVKSEHSGFLILFGLAFAVPGAAIGIATLRKVIAGTTNAEQIAVGFTIALLFMGAGIASIVWTRASTKMTALTREAMVQYPDRPWLWREDWAQKYVQAEWASTAGAMFVIGGAFLLFSVPIFMNLPAMLPREHPVKTVLMLVFPMAGVLLVSQSLLSYLRVRKFKNTRLNLSGVPCVIGGKLRAQLEVEFVFPEAATVETTLSCVRSYVSGSGEDRTRWERILWQERKTLAISTDGRTSHIPIDVTLPSDARETDTRHPDDEVLWRLTATSKLPALDFRASFTLPVFKTAASDSSLTTAAIEAHDEKALGGVQPSDSKIVASTAPDGGILFYFGPARNKR